MEVARAQLKRDGRAARRAREPRTFTEHARASDVIRRTSGYCVVNVH